MVKKKKIDIEEIINDMVKDNSFSNKDKPVARLILTWMYKGRKEAEKLPRVKKYINNLENNGFVDKKSGNLFLTTDDDEEMYIEFLLMLNGAYGFIQRVGNKK